MSGTNKRIEYFLKCNGAPTFHAPQRRANARGAISASAAVSARGSSTNKPSGGKSKQSDAKLPQSNEERKKAVDEGAKVVEELRNEMVGVAQSIVDKAEAECEAMRERAFRSFLLC